MGTVNPEYQTRESAQSAEVAAHPSFAKYRRKGRKKGLTIKKNNKLKTKRDKKTHQFIIIPQRSCHLWLSTFFYCSTPPPSLSSSFASSPFVFLFLLLLPLLLFSFYSTEHHPHRRSDRGRSSSSSSALCTRTRIFRSCFFVTGSRGAGTRRFRALSRE